MNPDGPSMSVVEAIVTLGTIAAVAAILAATLRIKTTPARPSNERA